ncbi:hypothetical protein EBZ35_06570 [bacterium]|nr:hypothetical protein [bacterium]
MNYLSRFLDLKTLLAKKSLFLLGPRSTGKSSMIRNQLNPDVSIDLLRGDAYLLLSREPWKLEPMVLNQSKSPNLIVIDEIQRIPELLNEVHRLIEDKQWIFLMTGSSAKKLRQKGVNLLAGRAWEARMCPLIPSLMLIRWPVNWPTNVIVVPSTFPLKFPVTALSPSLMLIRWPVNWPVNVCVLPVTFPLKFPVTALRPSLILIRWPVN